jgi:hypothetical protein
MVPTALAAEVVKALRLLAENLVMLEVGVWIEVVVKMM